VLQPGPFSLVQMAMHSCGFMAGKRIFRGGGCQWIFSAHWELMGPRGHVLGSDFGRASVYLLDPNPSSMTPVPGLVRQLGRLLVSLVWTGQRFGAQRLSEQTDILMGGRTLLSSGCRIPSPKAMRRAKSTSAACSPTRASPHLRTWPLLFHSFARP
jgi:hypothetical protein